MIIKLNISTRIQSCQRESKDDPLPCTSECSAGAEETEDKQQKSCEASDGNVKDGGCSVQLFTGNCIE